MTLRVVMRHPYADPETSRVPLLVDPPQFSAFPEFKSKRTPAFGCSLLGHALVISAILFFFGPVPDPPAKPMLRDYSVRFLQLQVPRPQPPSKAGGGMSAPRPALESAKMAPKTTKNGELSAQTVEHRKFELPR